MKKTFKSLFDIIKSEYIEYFAFILLLLWAISPIIEYVFKSYYKVLYTCYFSFITYVIGFFGIITYIIYIIKNKEKKLNKRKFIPEIILIILVVISIIASILSKNIHLSFFGESYRKEGLIVYIMYIGFILLSSIILNKKYMRYIFNIIILAALTITILPLFKSNFTYLNFTNIFHNLNHYGYYLMINVMLSAFMFIDNKKLIAKVLYLITYVFFIYLLIRNDTFGCYLAIFISLIVLLIYSLVKKYQRLNVVLLLLVFIVTSFVVSNFDIKIGERVNFQSTRGAIARNFSFLGRDVINILNNDEEGINNAGSLRGILWKGAWDYTLMHPIFGGGMESVGIYYNEKQIGNSDRPHNILLQVSSSIGIPGAIIYLGLIIYIALTNLKLMGKDNIHMLIYFTAMCYFISSMVGNSMYYTSPYFMILLGLLIGFNRRRKDKLD